MTGDRETGLRPPEQQVLTWRTNRNAPNPTLGEQRIQRSRDRLRNPMIPGEI